jgi:hypothetical protein
MGIIAQDPVLLSGSLRLNLDIAGSYSDDELYHALHQVQLLRDSEYRSLTAQSETSSVTLVDLSEPPTAKANIQSGANVFTNLDLEIKQGGDKWDSLIKL